MPFQGLRARAGVGMAADEGPHEQRAQVRVQVFQGPCAGWPAQPGMIEPRESAVLDAPLVELAGQRVVRVFQGPGEGVTAAHEQLEDEYGEAEAVVLGAAVEPLEMLPLQFAWGVLGGADRAAMDDAAGAYLEGVGVHQGHQSLGIDQEVFRVEVADDIALNVQGVEGSAQVGGDLVPAPPVERQGVYGLGVVGVEQGPGRVNARHEETGEAAPFLQHGQRPGDGGVAEALAHFVAGRVGQHGAQLVLARRGGLAGQVEFGEHVGAPAQEEDDPFPATGQLAVGLVALAVAAAQARHG